MNKQQVELLERRIEERHQRDMEAIKRVKQLLIETGIETQSFGDNGRQGPDPEKEEQIPAQANSLVSQVQALFVSNPTRPFTIASLEKALKEQGVVFRALKPSSSLHTAIRDLREKGIVKVYREGIGSQPNYYILLTHTRSEDHPVDSTQEGSAYGVSPKSIQGVLPT